MQKTFEKYILFDVADFVLDDDFIDWIIKPDEENNQFWVSFISIHSRQKKNIEDARRLITSLGTGSVIIPEEIKSRIWGAIQSGSVKAKVVQIKKHNTWMVAASIIIITLTITGYFYFNKNTRDNIAKIETPKSSLNNDVAPGGNKAILTLADGSTIILDSAQNGKLSNQGNIKIVKLNDGQLAYDKSSGKNEKEVFYNTISTPKGGQYQLILADGSRVWLNAASSLRYPAAFLGNERKVELTGEGYFEVAKNKEKPFRVSVNNATIEVLGTHFNINAYNDEDAVRTTLLEGSVKVSKGNASLLIVPGEQVVIDNSSDASSIKKGVDLEQVVAWKKGLFYFNKADLPTVMRQLSRWYDVNIVYEGKVPKREFAGEIQRDLHLSQVLELLGKNQVNFKIDGRKIIVMP